MEISHNDAIDLENLVRKVHNCERFGMGMYIDAGYVCYLFGRCFGP